MIAIESLGHVTLTCPAYQHLRGNKELGEFFRNVGGLAFCFHRDKWSFRQLRMIAEFFDAMWGCRQCLLGLHNQAGRALMEEEAQEVWESMGAESLESPSSTFPMTRS